MNKQIIDEAAEWFVEFSTGDADQAAKNAFDRWLRKSPEHVRVYLEILPIWDDGSIPLPGDSTSAEDLIALARGKDNIVSLERAGPLTHDAPAAISISQSENAAVCDKHDTVLPARRFAVAASIAVLLFAGAFAVWFQVYRTPTYATDLGQQRSITLSDGSSVELNTRSRIRVNFTRQARVVELLEGQALFRVAKDKQRPFTVSSDATQVRAVGTQFDVYRRMSSTTVTVVEGRVAVGNAGALASADLSADPAAAPPSADSERRVLVSAGQQITLTAAAPPAPQRADVALATAWTQGRLIFDSTPLPEVAEEFNRYNARQIVVEDAALRDFRVNGSFRSSDPTSLLRFLKEQPGLSVHETALHIRISRQ